MPKRGLTEIVCVLDRSGSMNKIITDAIGGFNAFLEAQQKEDGEANMSIVLFDDEYSLTCVSLPVADIKPFNKKTYVPRGSTALLDAIGHAVTDVQEVIDNTEEDARPERVIVVILTDGDENASKHWQLKKEDNGDTRPSVFDLIEAKKAGRLGVPFPCCESGCHEGRCVLRLRRDTDSLIPSNRSRSTGCLCCD